MTKNLFWLIAFGLFFSLGLASCAKDTEFDNPYADWGGVNEMYLDSIIDVARHAPKDEKWAIFKNYRMNVVGFAPEFKKYDSVYVKYLPSPDENIVPGDVTPLYTDSVDAYYQGYLVNGYRFDGNYTGKLNLEVHNPTRFAVNGVVDGWITALQEMHVGEYVELYVPYQMAYGEVGRQPAIPGKSVLRFTMYLEKIIHPKGPSDYSLKNQQHKEVH